MGVGFYGSQFLSKQFIKMGVPHWFYSAIYRNHSIAGDPMYANLEEIVAFIERVVVKGQQLTITQTVNDAKYPKVKTRFGVSDYLSSNYSN